MNKRSMKLVENFLRFFYAKDGASLILYFPDDFLSLTIDSPIGYDADQTFMNVRFEGIVEMGGAYALCKLAEDIIDGSECSMTIQCVGAMVLTLAGKMGQNGQVEAILTITKCDISTSFKFSNRKRKVNEVEKKSDLEVFADTMHEYLIPVCFRK